MRHFHFVTHVLHVVDDVVGVFLQRVVDARFEIRLRSVVVDPEPAAHIHVSQTRAGALHLDIHADSFGNRALDLPDIRDLAAEVEMQKLEAVLHSERLQLLERL